VSQLGELFGRAEHKLDQWGKRGWIAAMVLGFVVAWPVGLAILFYMIWSGRMGNWNNRRCGWGRDRHEATRESPSGNTAFDAYREATLKRLEEEQQAFRGFLDRLRQAKDQAEFDQFVAERNRPAEGGQLA
jgi:hypothetical protein